MNKELPEPEGFSVSTLFAETRSMAENYSKGAACPLTEWWDRDQVLAIQKQAYEDGLRDAANKCCELRNQEISNDRRYGPDDCEGEILDMLTASQKRDE